MAQDQDNNSADNGAPTTKPPLLERAVALTSLLLLIALISYLSYQAYGGNEGPPDIIVRVLSVQPSSAGYLVRFEARNSGGATAAAVTIEGMLRRNGAPSEVSRATLDFVPANSTREGGLFFTVDPEGRLDLRATGYSLP